MLLNSHALLLHIARVVSSLAALKFAVESFEVHNSWWYTNVVASESVHVGL